MTILEIPTHFRCNKERTLKFPPPRSFIRILSPTTLYLNHSECLRIQISPSNWSNSSLAVCKAYISRWNLFSEVRYRRRAPMKKRVVGWKMEICLWSQNEHLWVLLKISLREKAIKIQNRNSAAYISREFDRKIWIPCLLAGITYEWTWRRSLPTNSIHSWRKKSE